MIDVVDYDEAWPEWFEALRRRYEEALADVEVVAIEHIGSTSVPGLAAKPVIDVDVVVAREHVEAASAALERIGYEPLGDLGIVDRRAFRAPDSSVRTNTYVVVEGSLALRNHLAVRDVLRVDPGLRAEYAALKRRLAAELDDIDAYVEGKSPVLQRILAVAGIDAADRRRVDEANRRPSPPPPVLVRAATVDDVPTLWRMLGHAADWRPGTPVRTPADLAAEPSLAHYVSGWPGPDDAGVVAGPAATADTSGQPTVGAAWWRHLPGDHPGYGFVDEAIPEVSIGVDPAFRGLGVGTRLLQALVDEARHRRLPGLSLSVELDNPARRLYERLGFVDVERVGRATTMHLELRR